MDNNFVNVDDLVRQRLGGGEEQERSGAWLHMRELLDEEMPRRSGFAYWRRTLSASAVLLLIATISVGGYELSASRNGSTPVNGPASMITHNTSVNNLESKSALKAIGVAATHNETTNSNVPSSSVTPNNSATKTNTPDNKKSITTNNHSISKQKHLNAAKQQGLSHTAGLGNSVQNSDYTPLAANNIISREGNPIIASTPANKSAGNSKTDDNKKTTALAPTGTIKDDKTNTPSSGKPAGINSIGKPANVDKALVGLVENTNRKTTSTAVKTAKMAKMKQLALAGHSLSVSHPKVVASSTLPKTFGTIGAKTAANSPSKTALKKLPLNSHMAADKKKSGIAANTVQVSPTKVLAIKNEKKMVGAKALTVASSGPITQKPAIGNPNKTVKAAPGIAGKSSVENIAKDATAANEKKEKRVIQKLVLVEQEHYIKTDPGNGHFNLDTISMTPITQELAAAEENNPAPLAEKMSVERKTATAANNTPANNSIVSNGNNIGGSPATTDPHVLAGALASSSNSKPATERKDNSASATSTGAAALGSIESAFNDVKYNVKGAQFAAGLTAGINGTFFGPSSFNGFQFGVTGDFAFSSEWSFASELKYFQRANSNYSLNDNYTTYTPNPGGGYTVTQTTNSYNFTALHSIEMPLIVRYTNGKFNFFVGGNLVYSFSINEGYAQQTPVVTTAPAMGADTQPKINPAEPQSDFNSRFGVGCLFGISYKIAPNFNVDLRNVMTLWDNASSQGAKYVSDQVYKSPSLQLSLGYRLGSNKHKE